MVCLSKGVLGIEGTQLRLFRKWSIGSGGQRLCSRKAVIAIKIEKALMTNTNNVKGKTVAGKILSNVWLQLNILEMRKK